MCDCWKFNYFERKFETIERMLVDIKKQGEQIMSDIKDVDAIITQLGPGIDSIEQIVTDDDSLLTQLVAGVQALLAKTPASPDTANEVQALQAFLSKAQTAQTQLATQKANLQAAVTSATPPPAAS